MGTVTISAVDYDVYGTLTGADSLTAYAAASLQYASIFTASSPDNQKRAMVSATRIISRLPFEDVTYADPTTAGLPDALIEGSYELALAMLAGKVDIQTGQLLAGNVRSVNDGIVSLSFFGAGGQSGQTSPVWLDIIAPLLSGGGAAFGASSASGVDAESDFDRDSDEADGDSYTLNGA